MHPFRQHSWFKQQQTMWVCLALSLVLAVPLYAAEPVEIVVTGLVAEALDNVRSTLEFPGGLGRDGKVDRLWLERYAKQAEEKSRLALEPFGYYHAQVTATVESVGANYRLLVKVVPGEPVRLGTVSVTIIGQGREEKRLTRLATRFPLKTGDVLLQPSYEEAKAALKTRAQALGYLNADYSRHEIRIAPTALTATIELILDTGALHYFGVTRFKGAPEYPEAFLNRHLTYKIGERFSYSQLGETQRNFTNSERFKEVIITPVVPDPETFRVPVTVQLQAGPRVTLRPGIGYGTDTGARFSVSYRDLNMFHHGHELYANLFIAERLQGLVAGYVLPSVKDVRNSTTLQLNLQQEDTATYASQIAALELARNHRFAAGVMGTAYVKAQYEDYTVGAETATSRLLLPGVRFSVNQYVHPIRPRRGYHYALELRGTDQLLGSDTSLVQVLVEGSHLLPLPWRFSLHTRAKAGSTVLHDPIKDIPPSLRFFTGGDQSVRGYSYKSLGPRDSTGHVVGGTQLLTGSIELERALFKDWGVSLFYDAGNSFNAFSAVTLAQGAGLGLHYYTSVGALNLSLARPLRRDNPSIHIHFSVGFEI